MCPEVSISIRGADETAAMLKRAPQAIVGSGFVKAARAAADVIEAELEIRTPVRSATLWNDETFSEFKQETDGDLKAALKSEIELDAQLRGVHVSTGYGNQGYVANFVEYGHRMVTHKPARKEVGFVPAAPFMRPAAEAAADRAIEAFASVLRDTVKENYGS